MKSNDPNYFVALDRSVQAGVAEAIETHRRMRRPIVVWRDGQIVWIHPDDIEPSALPGDDDPLPPRSNGGNHS